MEQYPAAAAEGPKSTSLISTRPPGLGSYDNAPRENPPSTSGLRPGITPPDPFHDHPVGVKLGRADKVSSIGYAVRHLFTRERQGADVGVFGVGAHGFKFHHDGHGYGQGRSRGWPNMVGLHLSSLGTVVCEPVLAAARNSQCRPFLESGRGGEVCTRC